MYDNNTISQINRLKFENILWIIFAILAIINIYGDYNEIKYLQSNNKIFKNKSNQIFEMTLIVTLLIYIYFFHRNYKAFEKSTPEEKKLYSIKLLGSSLLIAGIICILYFQDKQTSFIGSPSL